MSRYRLLAVCIAMIALAIGLRPLHAQPHDESPGLSLPPGWPGPLPKSAEEMGEADWSKLATKDFDNWTKEKKPAADCGCTSKTSRIGPYPSTAVRWLTNAKHEYPEFTVVDSQLNLPSKPAGVAGSPDEEGIPIIIPTKVIIIKRTLKAVLTHFQEWRIETIVKCTGTSPSCPAPQVLKSRYGQKTGEEERAFVESCYLIVPQSMETGTFDTDKAIEEAKKTHSGKSSPPLTGFLNPPIDDFSAKAPTRPCQ